MAKDDKDLPRHKALMRYMAISAYLALEPPRGQRRAVLEQLAGKVWEDADGQPMQVQAETLRVWIRRYRRGGLGGLEGCNDGLRVTHLTDEDRVRALAQRMPQPLSIRRVKSLPSGKMSGGTMGSTN